MTRPSAVLVTLGGVLVLALLALLLVRRGRSYRGPLPPLTESQRALASELERDVRALCAGGPRNDVAQTLGRAAAHLERELVGAGYSVERHGYRSNGTYETYETYENLIVEIKGSSEIVVIGAHYDSVDESPGADDNASGTAALLALARRFAHTKPRRTLRFVFFTNEEPPHFMTESMGSWQYAKRARERNENVVAMVNLEMLGFYNDARGSQEYPPMLKTLYPDTADFVAFASNVGSARLTRRCAAAFRKSVKFPSELAILPGVIKEVSWSDHWSFWQFGYDAVIVSDTAMFRNRHYHEPSDTPDTLDYERMARVVEGLAGVVNELAR